MENDIYKLAFDRVKAMAYGKDITPAKITILVLLCIQIVENIATKDFKKVNISGALKKEIVIKLITEWVNNISNFNDDDKLYINNIFIPTILSGMIDSLCDLDLQKTVKNCMDKIFNLCGCQTK